ncbi:MAG: hypothetical protein GXO47_08300 [Chlorobi bacterium]|nr:hypothetical protein [Chlorobiota bacterium]
MVRFFIVIILAIPALGYSQVNDDFSDGNFTGSPQWTGTTLKFTVNDDHELQLNAPAEESEAWLFTKSTAIEEATWRITVRLAFNPSSNNYTRIYLASDSPDFTVIKNAVYVEIGQTSDDVCLYSISGAQKIKLIDGADDRTDLTTVTMNIEVTRTGNIWMLRTDTGTGYVEEGTADYNPGFPSEYFGIYCKYTSTRSTKFYFDNVAVSGSPFVDTIPPHLTGFEVQNGESLLLSFSETIDTNIVSASCFRLEKLGRRPSSVIFTDSSNASAMLYFNPALSDVSEESLIISDITDTAGNEMQDTSVVFTYERVKVTGVKVNSRCNITVTFSKPLDENSFTSSHVSISPGEFSTDITISGSNELGLEITPPLNEEEKYTLLLQNIKDISGDTILTTKRSLFYYVPRRFDIVFSELMTDPSPPLMLPESEYIELHNRTEFDIKTGGWKLIVNDKEVLLPDTVITAGGELLLVPPKDTDDWNFVENRAVLPVWPALTNTSGKMVLISGKGYTIDALRYDLENWGDGTFKQDGGWSFEIIDVNNRSATADNWKYSVNPNGGTPGQENSVKASFPDNTPPETALLTYETPLSVKLFFTETVNFPEDNTGSFITIKNNSIPVLSVEPDTIFLDNCTVNFANEMTVNQKHEFSDIGLTDFAGNSFYLNTRRYFGKPDEVDTSAAEIIINEVLFNPRPDGYDFVEIYNRSQKILNLYELSFAETDEAGEITKLYPLAGFNILSFPGDFQVFSVSPQNISDEYFCENKEMLCKVNSLPSMPDDEGNVTLTLKNGKIIDHLHYSEKMHFSLLNSAEGVSLERLSYDAPTNDPDNWGSASANSGYATPTAKNSQSINAGEVTATGFSIRDELFTPDSDGNKDELIIDYKFNTPENVATIIIYNSKGIPVRELKNNVLLGTSGFITWDGTDDNGALLRPGIYIIKAEYYNNKGDFSSQKLTCVSGIRSIVE